MQSINRRHTLRALGAAAATLSLSPWVLAQQAGIPATVKLVVPFPAGGAVDVVARKMAEAMAAGCSVADVLDEIRAAGFGHLITKG